MLLLINGDNCGVLMLSQHKYTIYCVHVSAKKPLVLVSNRHFTGVTYNLSVCNKVRIGKIWSLTVTGTVHIHGMTGQFFSGFKI